MKRNCFTKLVLSGILLLAGTFVFAAGNSSDIDDGFVFVKGKAYSDNIIERSLFYLYPDKLYGIVSDYYLCDHEVTQAEYKAVMGENPSFFDAYPPEGEVQSNRPVETVSWYDAIYFCNKLSVSKGLTPCYSINETTDVTKWGYTPHQGKAPEGTVKCNFYANGYRLPTEAEWEFAIIQKESHSFYFSDTVNIGWTHGKDITHEVKKKNPINGFYDMIGNVNEWCWRYDNLMQYIYDADGVASGEEYYIARGGCFDTYVSEFWNARFKQSPEEGLPSIGFRLARSSLLNVQLISEHGSVPENFFIRNGELMLDYQLPEPKEPGYCFTGWYTTSTFDKGTKVHYCSDITEERKLYAKWEKYTDPDDNFVFVQGGHVVNNWRTAFGTKDKHNSNWVFLSDFYMCDHEVTQEEYESVMKYNPSLFTKYPFEGEVQEKRPVENVSWFDAIYFCNKLSIQKGLEPCYSVNGNPNIKEWQYTPHKGESIIGNITCDFNAEGYRLPTTFEWKFAVGGGMKGWNGTSESRLSHPNIYVNEGWGISTRASPSKLRKDFSEYSPSLIFNTQYTPSMPESEDDYKLSVKKYTGYQFQENYDRYLKYFTHEVKTKNPNPLKLYDMVGNVGEYCWDCASNEEDIDEEDFEKYQNTFVNPTGISAGKYRCFYFGIKMDDYDWGYNPKWNSQVEINFDVLRSSPYYNGRYWLGIRLVRSAPGADFDCEKATVPVDYSIKETAKKADSKSKSKDKNSKNASKETAEIAASSNNPFENSNIFTPHTTKGEMNITTEPLEYNGQTYTALCISGNTGAQKADYSDSWEASCLSNSEMKSFIQNGNTIEFKALGDGKTWILYYLLYDDEKATYYSYEFTPKKGKVVQYKVPYSKFRFADWSVRRKYKKEEIRSVVITGNNAGQKADRSIKIFDVKVY